jgi:hypothetical protein
MEAQNGAVDVRYSVNHVTASHYFDEEQDPDPGPDAHSSEKLDPDLQN